jgi:hypothetical protein
MGVEQWEYGYESHCQSIPQRHPFGTLTNSFGNPIAKTFHCCLVLATWAVTRAANRTMVGMWRWIACPYHYFLLLKSCFHNTVVVRPRNRVHPALQWRDCCRLDNVGVNEIFQNGWIKLLLLLVPLSLKWRRWWPILLQYHLQPMRIFQGWWEQKSENKWTRRTKKWEQVNEMSIENKRPKWSKP